MRKEFCQHFYIHLLITTSNSISNKKVYMWLIGAVIKSIIVVHFIQHNKGDLMRYLGCLQTLLRIVVFMKSTLYVFGTPADRNLHQNLLDKLFLGYWLKFLMYISNRSSLLLLLY